VATLRKAPLDLGAIIFAQRRRNIDIEAELRGQVNDGKSKRLRLAEETLHLPLFQTLRRIKLRNPEPLFLHARRYYFHSHPNFTPM
jgi:hypothetical protein